MIRTANAAPHIRLEFIDRSGMASLVARDPQTGAECLVAPEVTDGLVNAVNQYLWEKLNSIAVTVETDPRLSVPHGQELLCLIYRAGFSALMQLMGEEHARNIDTVQEFFSSRIAWISEADLQPPIIDIVSSKQQHLPIEVLPLFGKAGQCSQPKVSDKLQTAKTLPGYCAILRRVSLRDESGIAARDPHPGYPKTLTLRFFRHNGLGGVQLEMKGLRSLEGQGVIRLSAIYPPTGHVPAKDWPELQLATVVANPFLAEEGIQTGTASHVCHFSCHIRSDPAKGPYLELRPDGRGFKQSDRYLLDELRGAFGTVNHVPPDALLLFLSACRSGVVDRSLLVSAVDAFRYLGPRSLVGALANIPENAAAMFSVQFYKELGAGSSVGAALRAARLYLLQEFENPLGLLFCSYFGEDSHVFSREDRRAQYLPPDEAKTIAVRI